MGRSNTKLAGLHIKKTAKSSKRIGKHASTGQVGKIFRQSDLTTAILKKLAQNEKVPYDKDVAPNVDIIPVAPRRAPGFPRRWQRMVRGKRCLRGTAEWHVPSGVSLTRRMLFLHGGGYTDCAPQDRCYRSVASRLARTCRLCVLVVDYRMAPEHRFPAAFDDCTAALRWIVDFGPSGRLAAEEVFVCGDSAGGGAALAIATAPLTASVHRVLHGIVVLSPWTDLTASLASYEERVWNTHTCSGDPIIKNRSSVLSLSKTYLGSRQGLRRHSYDCRASPLFAPPERLRKLPPILLLVGTNELLYGDSVDFHARLVKAGHKDATLSVYSRMWHFWIGYAEGGGFGQELAKARQALLEIKRWVRVRCNPQRTNKKTKKSFK